MKQTILEEKRAFRDIMLIVGVVMGFTFIVVFSSFYVSDAIDAGTVCGCVIPVPVMILILSSLGLFVGSFIYYFLSKRFTKEKKAYHEHIDSTLKFLDQGERKIVSQLVKAKGRLKQSGLESATGMHRVKIHRILKKLETKEIINKKSKGKINIVELAEDIKELFS